MIKGKPLLTIERIRLRVEELADSISTDYKGREIHAVGILKGAFMFYSDLVRRIQVPVSVDFIVASSYIKTATSGEVAIHADVRDRIEGKDVLLIEDIVDTGLTLKYIREHLLSGNPSSLKICAFLDKKAHRKVDVPIDYTGFEIPDHFVVGYGLDYDNRYRNLPYVAIFKEENK
jgi:hypoxanthine phosphoribosyltransferase